MLTMGAPHTEFFMLAVLPSWQLEYYRIHNLHHKIGR